MDAFRFWSNLDKAKGDKKTLKELCKELGIAYQRIADQRSDCRLPKLDDAYALALALGVSIEYLATGENMHSLTPEAKAVNESAELQALVRAVLRDPTLLRVISAVVESSEKTMGLA